MKKNSAVVFSIFVAVLITLFLVFSIFGILYFYWGDVAAVKDSLSTLAGLFGGFATLGATLIAAYLFNNWRDQHNKTVEKEMAWIVIQKFDAADFNLSRFMHDFQNFKYRCNFPCEMSDKEFQDLDDELNSILSSIKWTSLDFSSFLESLRKYSLIAEKTYYADATNDVQQINSIIFNTQNYRAHFPSSMNAIEGAIETIKEHVANIENKYINEILSELKALT